MINVITLLPYKYKQRFQNELPEVEAKIIATETKIQRAHAKLITIQKELPEAKEKIKKKATEERVLPDHIVDVPCKLKRFFAEMLLEYNMVAVEYVSENGGIRLWDESGNHKLFKKDFCGEAYEKEIEYFATEVEPNKFYNISDLITEKAEK